MMTSCNLFAGYACPVERQNVRGQAMKIWVVTKRTQCQHKPGRKNYAREGEKYTSGEMEPFVCTVGKPHFSLLMVHSMAFRDTA